MTTDTLAVVLGAALAVTAGLFVTGADTRAWHALCRSLRALRRRGDRP